ncbi:hypothetical protein AXE65_04385 [Ventosimonas gracilis]|uniref:Uncharacterized protein n=2 Tax=Ventosimonas gracilis TaxID=1680762 RepID=A0A139SQZ0_9GAMM|nr:hypothetical protein AXE65_04385 [Ventosimonas gracilis]
MDPKEDEHAQNALVLMQKPFVEQQGRNMWAALITLTQPNLTPEQRQTVADDYTEQFNHWYEHTYVDFYLKSGGGLRLVPSEEEPEAPKPPLPYVSDEYRLPASANNKALCTNADIANCLNIVREQPQATEQALAPYADVLEQIAALAQYDYYHVPLLNTVATPIPSFQSLFVSRSAHALTHINGHSDQALTGLCRDAHTARVLIANSNHLVAMMVGVRLLSSSLDVAAQIIAELPLDAALPPSCAKAFAPLTAETINLSLCSAMRGEFTALHSIIELEKKSLIYNQQVQPENVSDLDNVLLVVAAEKAAVCWPQIQPTLLKDEKFVTPAIAVSTWRQQCRNRMRMLKSENKIAYGIACGLAQAGTGFDHADYVHRMQDTNAQLQMMQVLLWLRQQPNLPQRLTSHYLQSSVPKDLYSSTQRPLTLSEDGSELNIPAYKKDSRERGLRLPLPQALRYGEIE